MTLTVRLPLRVEQELARYCVERKLSKSAAVKQAIDGLLQSDSVRAKPSPYELGVDLFGTPPRSDAEAEDVALNSKRLLRQHVRKLNR
jgi:hypothetical protein